MAADVAATLTQALSVLQAEKARIDRQIVGLEAVLQEGGASKKPVGGAAKRTGGKAKRTRRKLTATEKKAISRRMKASWAKRKAAKKKKATRSAARS
jgi:hypothetical protein